MLFTCCMHIIPVSYRVCMCILLIALFNNTITYNKYFTDKFQMLLYYILSIQTILNSLYQICTQIDVLCTFCSMSSKYRVPRMVMQKKKILYTYNHNVFWLWNCALENVNANWNGTSFASCVLLDGCDSSEKSKDILLNMRNEAYNKSIYIHTQILE